MMHVCTVVTISVCSELCSKLDAKLSTLFQVYFNDLVWLAINKTERLKNTYCLVPLMHNMSVSDNIFISEFFLETKM